MRPTVQLAAVIAALAVWASPASADTTFTQTVTPGGSFRTAEGPPTEATPLIVSGTISKCPSGPDAPCPAGPITLTIKFHGEDVAGLDGEVFEGEGWELSPAGRVIDVSLSGANYAGSTTRAVGIDSMSFDVDKSQLYPGFTGLGGNGGPQLGSLGVPFGKTPKPGRSSSPWGQGGSPNNLSNHKLADGDLRMTRKPMQDDEAPEGGVSPEDDPDTPYYGYFWEDASFLPVQPWGKATISSSFWVRAELPDALRHGVPVSTRSYYHCDLDVDLVVSPAVAHQLHLKSTMIGSKNHAACDGRVPINAGAKRALRRYSKVAGKVTVTSHNVDGTKTVKSTRFELTKPESDLG